LRGHRVEFVTPPRKCLNPDIVILGGGAVASPFYLNELPDCPRYALGIDIAYESEMDLLAAKDFKGIFIRNGTDIEKLRSKVSCPVGSMPDLAFLMRPSGSDVLSKYRRHPKKRCLGVFATDYVNPAIDRSVERFSKRANNFIVKMAGMLDEIVGAGAEVILVPCSTGGYGDDRRINLDIAAFMKNEPTLIFDTLGPQAMIDLIRDLDGSICMRFHAHIFSMIAGTPFISIEFTRKVKLFLEENGLTAATAGVWSGDEFEISKNYQSAVESWTKEKAEAMFNTALGYHETLKGLTQTVRQGWLAQSP
jgi:hypothetical protein